LTDEEAEQVREALAGLPQRETLPDRLEASAPAVDAFLRTQARRWRDLTATIASERPSNGLMEILVLEETPNAEVDVVLRNRSEQTSLVSRIRITVVRDLDYVAPGLEPSATYAMPVARLALGESRELTVRHSIPPRSVDFFRIDLADVRTLLLRICFEYDATSAVVGEFWLHRQQWLEEFLDEQRSAD
jgi:hypothetical protein